MRKLMTNARTTEVAAVGNQLTALFEKSNIQEAFLKSLFAQIDAQTKALTQAINQDEVRSLLEDADAKRDEAVRVLNKLLSAYVVFPNQEIKNHGQKVYGIFEKYGVKITTESYVNQSTLINALMMDLQAPELKSSLDALAGVNDAIESISATEKEFEALTQKYQQDQLKKGESATSLRKPLLESINKQFVPYVSALVMGNASLYGEFAKSTEKIISDVNTSIKSRLGS